MMIPPQELVERQNREAVKFVYICRGLLCIEL